MAKYQTNQSGDIEINNELEIPIGEIIAILEDDPRFAVMLRNVLLKVARTTPDLFGKYATKPTPITAQRPISGTTRIS